jgi:hypothetical protein
MTRAEDSSSSLAWASSSAQWSSAVGERWRILLPHYHVAAPPQLELSTIQDNTNQAEPSGSYRQHITPRCTASITFKMGVPMTSASSSPSHLAKSVGQTARQVAKRFGVSLRSVKRLLNSTVLDVTSLASGPLVTGWVRPRSAASLLTSRLAHRSGSWPSGAASARGWFW